MSTAGKPRILVIDDEANVTSLLRAFLESTGRYEVESANSGREGFEKARAFRPDLILLDVMMPDFGGDEFADRAKKEPSLRGASIVFMTGIVTKEEVRSSGGSIGGFPYLAKPISRVEELTVCIDANLHRRKT